MIFFKYLFFRRFSALIIIISMLTFLFISDDIILSKPTPSSKDKKNSNPKKKNNWRPIYPPSSINEGKNIIKTPLELAYFDLLIPGYGMYKLEKYYWSISYASLKLLGGTLIFLTTKNYIHLKDAYNTSGTENALNEANKAFLWLTFSLIFEILVYGISFWHTLDTASFLSALNPNQNDDDEEFYEINISPLPVPGSLKKDTVPNQLYFKLGYKYNII